MDSDDILEASDTQLLTDGDGQPPPSIPPPAQPTTVATSRLSTANVSRHTTTSDPRGAVEDDGTGRLPNENTTYQLQPVPMEAPPPYPGTIRSVDTERQLRQSMQLLELRDLQRALRESQVVTRQPTHGTTDIDASGIRALVSTHTLYIIQWVLSIHRIFLQQSDDEIRRSYKCQMDFSLYLMVTCCLLCNIPALLCTIPAVIVSWKVGSYFLQRIITNYFCRHLLTPFILSMLKILKKQISWSS